MPTETDVQVGGNRDASLLLNPNPGHCRTCGEAVKHPNQYCDAHRPAKKPPARATKKQASADRAHKNVTATPISIPGDIAAAGGKSERGAARRIRKSAPSVDQTASVLGRVLLYITVLIAIRLVSGDPDLHTEAEQEDQAKQLQLDDDQAKAIIHPIARLIQPTKLWATYGGYIIEHADVMDAAVALYEYGSTLVRYTRDRKSRELAHLNGSAVPVQSAPIFRDAPNGNAAPTYGEFVPGTGVLMTRDAVRKMRGDN
jgi:hypothetical protein